MKTITNDYRSYEDIDGKRFKLSYSIVTVDNKVIKVFNSVFGIWGHSIDPKSECFEYFEQKYNK